jgi:hypothetical protein
MNRQQIEEVARSSRPNETTHRALRTTHENDAPVPVGCLPTEAPNTLEVRESRARRAAARQGLRLEKSRRRDHRASDFGTFRLIDIETNALAVWAPSPDSYGLTLDEIESTLGEAQ